MTFVFTFFFLSYSFHKILRFVLKTRLKKGEDFFFFLPFFKMS